MAEVSEQRSLILIHVEGTDNILFSKFQNKT